MEVGGWRAYFLIEFLPSSSVLSPAFLCALCVCSLCVLSVCALCVCSLCVLSVSQWFNLSLFLRHRQRKRRAVLHERVIPHLRLRAIHDHPRSQLAVGVNRDVHSAKRIRSL